MRFRFKPTSEQRIALRGQMVRLQQPETLREAMGAVLPPDFKPTQVMGTLQSVHPDRFVMRVQLRSESVPERAYALKVYSDDFVERVWAYSQTLVEQYRPGLSGICLPFQCLAQERALVSPWVDGEFLTDVVDGRRVELMQAAARVAADLHRVAIVPEELTTAQMLVEETRARCGRLCDRWPETTRLIEPLLAVLEEDWGMLDPAVPAPVHGG